jgi:hypothetical protein
VSKQTVLGGRIRLSNRMGMFSWLFRRRVGSVSGANLLPGTGRGYFVEVVGESNYQDALVALRRSLGGSRECTVLLAAEPDNAFDKNAVVVKSSAGLTLGYLTREDAARYQQVLLQLAVKGHRLMAAAAQLVGGTNSKPSIGVWLDLQGATIIAKSFELDYKRVKS